MARRETKVIDNYGGISIAKKIGQEGSFRFGKHLDIHSDPNDLTLLPTTRKVSGSTVTGLIKWIEDGTPHDSNRYFYDDVGKIYREDRSGTWSTLQTTTNSKGQGLAVHGDYLYYTQNDQIGRYGPLSGTPSFDDDWQTGLNSTVNTGFAPIITFKEGFAVGHGNKVGWWDGAVWNDEALVLPAELNVRSFTKTDQYIVIGAWRGNSVTDSEDGYIFVWDSLSDTFNDFAPTDGGLNAMCYSRNKLLSIHGHQGYIYTDSAPFNKVHQIPKIGFQQSVEVYPGAMSTWKGQTYFGVSDGSNSEEMRGVYSYGSKSQLFRDALNYAFSISTGNSGSTVQISAVKGFGNELYIAWRDGTSYGVDKIDNTSAFATTGTYESLMEDDQRPKDEKRGVVIEVAHLPLATGQSIAINYKINRASSWTSGTTNSTVDTRETSLYVTDRFYEFEWQTILTGPGSSTPTVIQQNFPYEDNKEERRE
jgi:hypothetical protein